MMKAVVYTQYGAADVLHVQEVVKPQPKENEVLIKIVAAAVSSTDSIFRKGDQWMVRLAFGVTRPKKTILGTEFSGVIVQAGKQVTRFKVGDQVYAASGVDLGAHAEYICLPEDGAMAIKPNNVDFEQAAAICEGGLTALPFLRDTGRIQAGQKVLINGASGSVGVAAVQLAKYFGAHVIGVCSTANMKLVKSLGADEVIDYTREDFTENVQHYDVIFDAVGKSSFNKCKESLTPTGVYLTTVASWNIFFHALITAKSSTKKARLSFTGLRSNDEKSKDLHWLKKLIESGKMKSVIGKQYTLEQVVDAHRYVETGHKVGNVVITLKL
jgi:NADPH:quinone reductase-like Zn-dependent oxidoreductase